MDPNEVYDVATGNAELDTRTVHVRVAGRTHDLSASLLSLHEGSSDGEIKAAVSEHLDIPLDQFRNIVVERTGKNFTLRPEAVFGV